MSGHALVTGGAGFIGGCMVRRLIEDGWRVTIVDDLSNGERRMVPQNARLVEANKGDLPQMSQLFAGNQIDVVFDFAASIDVGEGEQQPARYYQNNVCNTVAFASAAADAGVSRFVFSSTAAVYGLPETSLVSEDHPLRPFSVYGKTKASAEMAISDILWAAGCKVGILRYFNVSGSYAGQFGQYRPGQTHIMKKALDVVFGEEDTFTIFGTDWDTPDGTGVRDYIHVMDLVDAHLMLAEHLARTNNPVSVYNCGYGRGASVREVLDTVRRVTGRPLTVVEGGRRPGDAGHVVADNSAIRRELGWVPKREHLDTIVGDAVAWRQTMRVG